MAELTPKNLNRLAKAIMQRHHVSYERACEMLGELKLNLICGEEIRNSPSLQAAVLTAINCGKRAFLGGVAIALPENTSLRIPWPTSGSFNKVVKELGAVESIGKASATTRTIVFGDVKTVGEGLCLACDGWRGGVFPVGATMTFEAGSDFALGGVFAGAFAVARSFLSASEISNRDVMEPTGYSLWRPDLSWLSADAIGPDLESLPAKLWLLGLGHLGQAYAWTLGLLPFSNEQPAKLFLQDYDLLEKGNWSAGLLCEESELDKLKTRICANWLEARGFKTRLIERPFDHNIRRGDDEPRIALCGFDNPESRQLLEDAGFELVVDASLGASMERFDRIVLRTFPDASTKARDIYSNVQKEKAPIDQLDFGEKKDECGIVLDEIAGKAISSSFTGACAGALVLAEVLRALHGGKRCEFLNAELRSVDLPTDPYREEQYILRVARNGILPIRRC
ncbi:MAG: hypothetical protein WCD79_22445 [Chthoniobacteraceae bacterium]